MYSIFHSGRQRLEEQWKWQDSWYRAVRTSSLRSLQIHPQYISVRMRQDIFPGEFISHDLWSSGSGTCNVSDCKTGEEETGRRTSAFCSTCMYDDWNHRATGISFLFVAPILFVVQVILAGSAYMIAHMLNIAVGLTFSGGFIDLFLFGILQEMLRQAGSESSRLELFISSYIISSSVL